MNLVVGQLLWAVIQGHQKTCVRACVVTTVEAAVIEVVYGQGKAWGRCRVPFMVRPSSLLGRRLGLTKDTHFCGMQVIPIGAVNRVCTDLCPASDFVRIEAVAVEARLAIAARIQVLRAQPQPQQQQQQQPQQAQAQAQALPSGDDSSED